MTTPTARPRPREASSELLVLAHWETFVPWLLDHCARWPRSARFSLTRPQGPQARGSTGAREGAAPARASRHRRRRRRTASVLREQLRGRPCRVFGSDLRIRVRASGLATYPDASVVCSRLEVDPNDPSGHTVVNPTLLVEVLSPSTEAYDRGEKLAHYKRIPSLREVVLVAQDERRLELWRREGERWTVELARGDEVAYLSSLDCALPLAEIYLDPLARYRASHGMPPPRRACR